MTDMTEPTWFVGVDWGSRTHQVCILDGTGAVRGEQAFKHGGAGLAALAAWIVEAAGGMPPAAVGVAIAPLRRRPPLERRLRHVARRHDVRPAGRRSVSWTTADAGPARRQKAGRRRPEVPFRSSSTSSPRDSTCHPKGRNAVEEPRSGLTRRGPWRSGVPRGEDPTNTSKKGVAKR